MPVIAGSYPDNGVKQMVTGGLILTLVLPVIVTGLGVQATNRTRNDRNRVDTGEGKERRVLFFQAW